MLIAGIHLYVAEHVPRATMQVMLQGVPSAEPTQESTKDSSNFCCSNNSFLQSFRQVEVLSHFRQGTAYQRQIPTYTERSSTSAYIPISLPSAKWHI
jgi:hypothetical protein